MRRNLCSYISFYIWNTFSGFWKVEGDMEVANSTFRRCANIKSKKHPDRQCSAIAIDGDYCTRHCKRPHRYVASTEPFPSYPTRSYQATATKIQTWWRFYSPLLHFRNQGPAYNYSKVAQNTTEVYTMESIEKIPKLFFFSFSDSNKNIWVFDLRSLSHLLSQGISIINPYTRDEIPSQSIHKIHTRLSFLRKQKYPVLYIQEEQLSPEQIWNQQVLDVFMKLEAHGYSAAISWYNELDQDDHVALYTMLYQLWAWRLGLSNIERENIVPGHLAPETRLFKWTPEAISKEGRKLKWWKKHNLHLIQQFVTRSVDKTKQALGTLYVIMGLVSVSESAAEAYPWIAETLDY